MSSRGWMLAGLLGACSIGYAHAAWAQPVTLFLRPPAPGQLVASDLWNATLVNAGPDAATLTFRAEVRRGGVPIFEALSGPVTLPAGSHTLDSRGIEPIRILQSSVGSSLDRTGSFPDGAYTICLEASSGGMVVATSCLDHVVSTVQPPILLQPADGSTNTDPFIVWTWFMQPATASGEPVSCDLTVVEVLSNQSPEEALRVNTPVILRADLRTTVWQTNEGVRKFRPGQRFAWKVTARVGGRVVSESQVQTFVYVTPEGGGAVVDSVVQLATIASAKAEDITTTATTTVLTADSAAAIAAEVPTAEPVDRSVEATDPGATPGSPAPPEEPPGPRPLVVHTKSRSTAESANRTGTLSLGSRDYVRFEIDPTLEIYGSPLALNILVSTERGNRRHDLQRGSFEYRSGQHGFVLRQRIAEQVESLQRPQEPGAADTARMLQRDPEALIRELKELHALSEHDPQGTARKLERLGVLSDAEATAFKIPAFAFGSVTPDFGELFMSGVTINGGMVEHNPGRFYGALAAGKLQRVGSGIRGGVESEGPELYQDLYMARVGMGLRRANHLILSGLYARDDGQTRDILALPDPGARPAFQENIVLDLAGRLYGLKQGAILDAEIGASLFTPDRDGPVLSDRPARGILKGLFGERIRENSATDWAGGLRGALRMAEGRARVTSGVRFVGPGYVTPGVRSMRRDVFKYEGSYDQSTRQRGSWFSSQWSWEKTGVVLPENGFSSIGRLSTRAGVQPARHTGVDIGYARNEQRQRAGGAERSIRSHSDFVNLRVRQSADPGALRSLTLFSADLWRGRSDDVSGSYDAWSFTVQELVSLPSRFGFMVRGTNSNTITDIEDGPDTRVWDLESSISYDDIAGGHWIAGGNYLKSKVRRQAGGFAGVGYRLGRFGVLDFRWNLVDSKALVGTESGFMDRVLTFRLATPTE